MTENSGPTITLVPIVQSTTADVVSLQAEVARLTAEVARWKHIADRAHQAAEAARYETSMTQAFADAWEPRCSGCGAMREEWMGIHVSGGVHRGGWVCSSQCYSVYMRDRKRHLDAGCTHEEADERMTKGREWWWHRNSAADAERLRVRIMAGLDHVWGQMPEELRKELEARADDMTRLARSILEDFRDYPSQENT